MAEVNTSHVTSQDALCQNTLDWITSSSIKRDFCTTVSCGWSPEITMPLYAGF